MEQLGFSFSEEVWKPVVGYEKFYEVSNKGRVRSLDRRVWNGRSFYTLPGRMMTQSLIRKDRKYLKVTLRQRGSKKIDNKRVHRLVAEAFIAKIKGKEYVNHLDGDPQNNCVENLEWVDLKENSSHATKVLFKNNNFYSKQDVIAREYLEGASAISLAKKYKTSPETIKANFEERGIWKGQRYFKKYNYNKEELAKDFDAGLSYRELMEKYNICYQTLAGYKHLHKKGEWIK